jgi:hypothetical protein
VRACPLPLGGPPCPVCDVPESQRCSSPLILTKRFASKRSRAWMRSPGCGRTPIDRITAHVRDHFAVPICLVTLVEADRQLILSRQGVDVRETPRNVSFCTYTILQAGGARGARCAPRPPLAANPYVTATPSSASMPGPPDLRQRHPARLPLHHRPQARPSRGAIRPSNDARRSRGLGDHQPGLGLPEPDISLALQ